ncbi:MAG: hypothetical protein R3B09_35560, partial [Nannocystaceae bacterium]
MRRPFGLALGLALSAACNAGSGPDPKASDPRGVGIAGRSPMEIRLPLEQEILTLDPAQASDAMSRRITGQLYDTLLDWDPYGGGLVPELLAEAPTLDAAGTTMSLRLRAGADARRFAADPCLRDPGGRAVEAEDVILTLLRHSDPGLAGAWGLLAGRIVGLDRWRERWKTRAGGPEGLTIDPETGA